jgi:transposase
VILFFPDGLIREDGPMNKGVELRSDFTAAELRGLARKSRDGNQARRLLALAAVYEGKSREEAARLGGMDRQTLRDWVHRFNGEGPAGLLDRKPPGPRRKLTGEQEEELRRLVEAGPDPRIDGVVRWRCKDLKAKLGERFGIDLSRVTVGRRLKALGFSHISARPQHPAQKAGAAEAFKKTSQTRQPGS